MESIIKFRESRGLYWSNNHDQGKKLDIICIKKKAGTFITDKQKIIPFPFQNKMSYFLKNSNKQKTKQKEKQTNN